MYRHFSKFAALAALVGLASLGLWGQEKKVKDQAEYDLFNAVVKETDNNKKIQLLDTWKEKYPDSDYRIDRLQYYVLTYQALGQGEKMYQAAKEILALEPKNTFGLVWVTLLTDSLKNTAPDRLDYGEKTARTLLSMLPEMFAESKKPDSVTPEVWKQQRTQLEVQARKALVFIQAARKDNEGVEREITTILKMHPNSGALSYQLGTAIVAQKKPEKQIHAFYHFARAAYYTGDDALSPDVRKQVQAYLEKVYTSYHGSKEGLQELIELARKGPFPPEGFDIKSAQQIAIEEENRLRETNPQLAIWMGVKKELLGPNGPTYFESALKGAALPKLKGKVVSHTPAARPKEILVALATPDTAEIKLRLDNPLANRADPGTEIEFEGAVAAEFASDPFLLTVDLERDQLKGWPAAPRPAPKATKKK